MESVVYQDSPLAEYLEGAGEADDAWTSTSVSEPIPPLTPDSDPNSFAPRGFPSIVNPKTRARTKAGQARRPPSLKTDDGGFDRNVAQIVAVCADVLAFRPSDRQNAKILEELRYTIIGSQLLSDRANVMTRYRSRSSPSGQGSRRPALSISSPSSSVSDDDRRPSDDRRPGDDPAHTTLGVCLTLLAAFALAWSIHWARPGAGQEISWDRVNLVLATLIIALGTGYVTLRRQFTRYTRNSIVTTASETVANIQAFNAAASEASSLIQEVEIVARGYRISCPLPPASRLDGQLPNQTRRCAKLRRALRASLDSLIAPQLEAYRTLLPFVAEIDMEQYHDIYEISRTDIDEAIGEKEEPGQERPISSSAESEDPEGLRSLKAKINRLQLAQRLFLCCVLALDTVSRAKFSQGWSPVTDAMLHVGAIYANETCSLDAVLCADEQRSALNGPTPATLGSPEDRGDLALPSTPRSGSRSSRVRSRSGRDRNGRTQAQLRKFANLSRGLKELQAKMHILREESERSIDSAADEPAESGSEPGQSQYQGQHHHQHQHQSLLLSQYDAIGADLRSLMDEWQAGRAALTANIDRLEEERRRSRSSAGILSVPSSSCPSTPISGEGLHFIGGGGGGGGGAGGSRGTPFEALKILNGDATAAASGGAALTMSPGEDDEMVLEAIAMPRAMQQQQERSTLSREERIARMAEEREARAAAKQSADASRGMIRELENVIKLRPAAVRRRDGDEPTAS